MFGKAVKHAIANQASQKIASKCNSLFLSAPNDSPESLMLQAIDVYDRKISISEFGHFMRTSSIAFQPSLESYIQGWMRYCNLYPKTNYEDSEKLFKGEITKAMKVKQMVDSVIKDNVRKYAPNVCDASWGEENFNVKG